ncbi:protein of unknown function (plasmid) [Cupriavidus taiwanensis]|nr:protein of unknown function [Cupriavidus taiwanensis]
MTGFSGRISAASAHQHHQDTPARLDFVAEE